MGWLSGIFKGDAFSGPLGEILDAALTHASATETNDFDHEDRLQAAFFVAVFALLAKMAAADGLVSLSEIEAIDRFIDEELDCSPAIRRFAVRVFNEAKESPHGFKAIAGHVRKLFGHEPHLRYEILEILGRVAMADGTLAAEESRLLDVAAKALKVPRREAAWLRVALSPGPTQAYAILRCEPSASADELQEQYARLCEEYDAEAELAHGLPREFLRLTGKRRTEIEEAFDALAGEPVRGA